jgi:tetratricopeptide (TPR) repeat protein
MKAKRRHELKTNTLATNLQDLPELARRWGSSVLLAVVVVSLAIVLLRVRSSKAAERRQLDAQSIQNARERISQLRSLYLYLPRDTDPSPGLVAEIKDDRDQMIDNAVSELQAVQLDSSADDVLLAAELEAEGDLDLTIGQMPALPGSGQDSSLNLSKSPENYLKDAAAAYQQIVDKYPNQTLAAFNARFGLATIAEDQKNWDAAAREYQAILDASNQAPAVHARAQSQLAQLDTLKSTIYFGKTPLPTSFANLMPSVDPPSYLRVATTAPSISTTQPATSRP